MLTKNTIFELENNLNYLKTNSIMTLLKWFEKRSQLISLTIIIAAFLLASLIFNNWDRIFH